MKEPPTDALVHQAFQCATACVNARYQHLDVDAADLLEGHDPAHVVWALAESLATCLRNFSPALVENMLQLWGAMAILDRAQEVGPDELQDR